MGAVIVRGEEALRAACEWVEETMTSPSNVRQAEWNEALALTR
jgi:hypothetical protein